VQLAVLKYSKLYLNVNVLTVDMVAQHCYNGDGSGDVTFLWEKGEFETLKQIVSLSHLIMWTR